MISGFALKGFRGLVAFFLWRDEEGPCAFAEGGGDLSLCCEAGFTKVNAFQALWVGKEDGVAFVADCKGFLTVATGGCAGANVPVCHRDYFFFLFLRLRRLSSAFWMAC